MAGLPVSILVVCLGNTCRSPMAAGFLRQMLGERSAVESAGIDTAIGLPATKQAVSVMKEFGIDISAHQSCDIEKLDLATFDVVLAITSEIADRLRERGVQDQRLVQLDIADPYCKGIEVYRSTAQEIQRQLTGLRLAEKIFGPET